MSPPVVSLNGGNRPPAGSEMLADVLSPDISKQFQINAGEVRGQSAFQSNLERW